MPRLPERRNRCAVSLTDRLLLFEKKIMGT
jgi:hypothetical protein